ncbi:MAG: carboxypeptidase-like regulatory domain-containing protein [Candidatus Geothermarchaeales archaeon]
MVGILLSTLLLPLSLRPTFAHPVQNALTFSLKGVEDVSPAHLEGWAIFGDEKVSTGKFMVDSYGATRNLQGEAQDRFVIDHRDLSLADLIVITIEAQGDTDTLPSGIVLLAGTFSGSMAELSFPVDLSGVSGIFILATPTDGPNTNELSGVWFLQLPPPPQPGLDLPELPGGWVYEGWAVNSGVPITTGRFTSVSSPDDFDSYSGPQAGPPFPGEDLLENAPEGLTFPPNLADGSSKVVISVEPDIEGEDPTGSAPFAIKPLVGDIPLDAADHVNYEMGQNLGSIPRGLARISFPTPTVAGLVVDFRSRVEVEGSTVTLRNIPTWQTWTAESDFAGNFRFEGQNQGLYLVKVEAPGYYARLTLVYLPADGYIYKGAVHLFPM